MRRLVLLVALTFLCLPVAVRSQQPAGPSPKALFEKGMNALTGTGASRSDLTALDCFRRSADLGYAPAQVVMGYFAETGTLAPQEPQQAASWFKKAAQQGDRLGQWLLGSLYFAGMGVSRDLNEAERWLKPAADQGDPFGQYLMGLLKRERGDYVAAADWFRKASNQGLPQAQKQLGLLLKQGQGRVAVDKTEAYIWLLLVFQAGDQSVANDVSQLEAELGSAQTEQAKTQARERQGSVSRTVVSHGCTGWSGEFDELPAPPPPDLQRFCR